MNIQQSIYVNWWLNELLICCLQNRCGKQQERGGLQGIPTQYYTRKLAFMRASRHCASHNENESHLTKPIISLDIATAAAVAVCIRSRRHDPSVYRPNAVTGHIHTRPLYGCCYCCCCSDGQRDNNVVISFIVIISTCCWGWNLHSRLLLMLQSITDRMATCCSNN